MAKTFKGYALKLGKCYVRSINDDGTFTYTTLDREAYVFPTFGALLSAVHRRAQTAYIGGPDGFEAATVERVDVEVPTPPPAVKTFTPIV